MKVLLASHCWMLLAASHGVGAVLLEEAFGYPDGAITAVSDGRWSTHSGATPEQVDITNGEVQLRATETEDVNTALAGRPYPASGAVNRFYARFTVRFSGLPSPGGAWFAAFKDTTATGFRCRVFALTSGATPGRLRLGLSSANNAAATVLHAASIELHVPYTVVLKLENTTSAATLWLNPAREGDASVMTSEVPSAFTVAAFALRQNSGIGTLALDDLVVGTSFDEVLPRPDLEPQPPSVAIHPPDLSVVEGEAAGFTSTASGSSPLSFQWMLDAFPIVGATNRDLVLTDTSFAHEGEITLRVANALGTATSAAATLTVVPRAARATKAAFTLLSYNTHGNQVADWTTNAAQVRAIGRQVEWLDPDIITFQEIPLTNNGVVQMTYFVAAFRPGFHLASNSGTDGFVKSVILSRFPIVRSTKWLDGVRLDAFGYDGTFTRDLFEAEIRIPALPQPLHVFTTHLKSGQDPDSTARRAAEARAISNFFARGFLTTNAARPYVLTGDMNEDEAAPPSGGVAIPIMVGSGTGLRLTTPLDPVTRSHLTFSIRAAELTRRYDYILPSALLAGNVITSLVFRADVAADIAPVLPGDAELASDHLPLVMTFSNPYETPFRVRQVMATHEAVTMRWNGVPGGRYGVETSRDLVEWNLVTTLVAGSRPSLSFTTNTTGAAQFFRVRTAP